MCCLQTRLQGQRPQHTGMAPASQHGHVRAEAGAESLWKTGSSLQQQAAKERTTSVSILRRWLSRAVAPALAKRSTHSGWHVALKYANWRRLNFWSQWQSKSTGAQVQPLTQLTRITPIGRWLFSTPTPIRATYPGRSSLAVSSCAHSA